jgi:MFS transporter, YNFM family, putative membrane transport protein
VSGRRLEAVLSPLVLLSSAGFVSGMSMRIPEPLLPRVAEDFGVGVGRASVLISGFVVAYGLFQLVHGPLGDRFGKLRTVTVACVAASLACALCATASDLNTLTVYRFLSGATAGAVIPLSLAYVGDTVAFVDRQAALANYLVGTLIGQTVGPLVGGAFGDLAGWRATFLVPAAAFLAIGSLLLPTARRSSRPEKPAGSINPLRGYGPLLRRRHVRIVLVAVGLEGVLFMGAFGFLGAFLRQEYDLGYTAIGLILSTFGLGGLAYVAFARRLIARLGQRGLVLIGGGLIGGAFLAIAAVPAWEVCLPAIVVLGVGFAMLHGTLQTRATEMAPEVRGAGVSAFVFAIFFGQTIGVAAIGAMVDTTGYRSLFAGTGVLLAVLALWFRRRLPELERARVKP